MENFIVKKYVSCKYTTKGDEHNSKRFHFKVSLYLFVLAMGTGHVRLSGGLLNSFRHLILSIHLRISLQKFFSIPLQQGHRATLVTAPLPVGDRFPVESKTLPENRKSNSHMLTF